jgi:hypothetical protein
MSRRAIASHLGANVSTICVSQMKVEEYQVECSCACKLNCCLPAVCNRSFVPDRYHAGG